MSADKNKKNDEDGKININLDFGLGKLFGNLKDVIDTLSDISNEGINKEGEVKDTSGKVKGVYGFTVKTMGEKTTFEGFGNKVKKAEKDGSVVIENIREPIVDIFYEEQTVNIVAEMPGIKLEDIKVEFHGDIVKLSGKSEDREYEKEILLKYKVNNRPEKKCYKNGIFELTLNKE